ETDGYGVGVWGGGRVAARRNGVRRQVGRPNLNRGTARASSPAQDRPRPLLPRLENEMPATGVTSLHRAECLSCAQAEPLRCRTKSSFARDNSEWNALRLRRKRKKFDPTAEGVVKSVRGDSDPGTGVHRREEAGPAVVLLHEPRLIFHPRKDGIHIDAVLGKFPVQQSNEGLARCFRQ